MQIAQGKPKHWQSVIASILIFVTIWVLLTIGIRLASSDVILGADYYTFYTAARMYLLEGTNPYSDEVTQTAQIGIRGRLVSPDEDQLAFAYPFFMLFLVIPFGWLDVAISQALWMSLNLIVSILVLTYILHRNKLLIPFALTFYPIVFGLILGNFAYLLGFVLLYSLHQILFEKPTQSAQMLIGFLLAWTLGKPQLTLLILLFIILVSYIKKYTLIIKSFTFSSLILILISLLLSPKWPVLWLHQIQKYAQYNQSKAGYILSVLFSNTPLASLVFPALMLATIISILVWLRLKVKPTQNQELPHNLLFTNLFLALSLLLMPRTLSTDQILIFIGLVLGTKYLNNYKITIPLWLFYTSLSWITFASGEIFGFSPPNVIFPLVASTTWPLIFWLLTRKTTREFDYAPS